MTDLNETIKVMQHFRDGGEVEARHISEMTGGICRDPDWNFALFKYRIKPEKQKRLMTAKELLGKVITKDGEYLMIVSAYKSGNIAWSNGSNSVEYFHSMGWTLENGDSLEVE